MTSPGCRIGFDHALGKLGVKRAFPALCVAVGRRRVRVHFASGNGGNKVYIVPRQQLVVVVTSAGYGKPDAQRRAERILIRALDSLSSTMLPEPLDAADPDVCAAPLPPR